MIPLFRKIRYRLAQDNQFVKFTQYAIGEIVLVVVGILIALQVNNWNESKKDREFELEMLHEVANSLRSDKAFLEMIERLKIEQDLMSFNKMHIANLQRIVEKGIKLIDNELEEQQR